MSEIDELKVRAQAESSMLGVLLQPGINQAVLLAGELAVTRARLEAAEKKLAQPPAEPAVAEKP